MSFCLILLAAGDSKRFNSKIPKPFVKIGGKTLLEHSLIKFSKVIGGKTRQISTLNALKYIKKNKFKCSNVLIHDSARPNISTNLIKKIINSSSKKTIIPKIPIHDALKENISDDIVLNLPRENFFSTQTPQSFKFKEILF